jgi:hypothetical protein
MSGPVPLLIESVCVQPPCRATYFNAPAMLEPEMQTVLATAPVIAQCTSASHRRSSTTE